MREITLPPVHNKRSPAQWEIISKHVDFKGKTVLDLGCGYADLLWRIWGAGAKHIIGVDKSVDIMANNRRVVSGTDAAFNNVHFCTMDVWDVVDELTPTLPSIDVTLCFSVLPYLSGDILGMLEWIQQHSRLAFIECQYAGDGPGPESIKSDADMWYLMEGAGWTAGQIATVGTTYIPDRDKHRTIWMCES